MVQIFKSKLLERMKKEVQGEISIHIINDTLVVDINNGYTHYRYTEGVISTQIILGLTTKELCNRIVKSYRNWLFSKYLY